MNPEKTRSQVVQLEEEISNLRKALQFAVDNLQEVALPIAAGHGHVTSLPHCLAVCCSALNGTKLEW